MPESDFSEKTYLIDLLVAHDGDYPAAALSAGLSTEDFRARVGRQQEVAERFADDSDQPTEIEAHFKPPDTRVSKVRLAKADDFGESLGQIGLSSEVVKKAIALNNLGKKHLVAMMSATNASGFEVHQKLVAEVGEIQKRLEDVRALIKEGVSRDEESGVLVERDAESRNYLSMEEDRLVKQMNEIAKRGVDVMKVNYTFAAMMVRQKTAKGPKAGYGRSED